MGVASLLKRPEFRVSAGPPGVTKGFERELEGPGGNMRSGCGGAVSALDCASTTSRSRSIVEGVEAAGVSGAGWAEERLPSPAPVAGGKLAGRGAAAEPGTPAPGTSLPGLGPSRLGARPASSRSIWSCSAERPARSASPAKSWGEGRAPRPCANAGGAGRREARAGAAAADAIGVGGPATSTSPSSGEA